MSRTIREVISELNLCGPHSTWEVLTLQGRLIAPFFVWKLFLFMSLSTDYRTLLCKRRIEDFRPAQIVKFVSFTAVFTSKYEVKSVKETCETVHSIPKETCQNATLFD